MDALEAARNDRFDAQQLRSLGGPVARRAGAVFLSREYQGRYAFLEIAHRGIINEHLFAARLVNRDAAFDARALRFRRNHQIFNPDVGKGAAHDHLMIAAPRAIAIEIGFLYSMIRQPPARWSAFTNRARGTDVVGRD